MEALLLNNESVVAFFSCITALNDGSKQQKRKKIRKEDCSLDSSESEEEEEEEEEEQLFLRKLLPGMAFWIAVDWPTYATSAIEETIGKNFLGGLQDLVSCKAIKPRGKSNISGLNTQKGLFNTR